ncbi:hypothetical protein L7F22_039885 [Adiantum nelumboides]|nr:hypothetical protein [Adiantum nelumboides]
MIHSSSLILGSTHNYISVGLASKLRIHAHEIGETHAAEGPFEGPATPVTPFIGKLRLHVQGYVDKEDVLISNLKNEYVLLEAPWFDRMTVVTGVYMLWCQHPYHPLCFVTACKSAGQCLFHGCEELLKDALKLLAPGEANMDEHVGTEKDPMEGIFESPVDGIAHSQAGSSRKPNIDSMCGGCGDKNASQKQAGEDTLDQQKAKKRAEKRADVVGAQGDASKESVEVPLKPELAMNKDVEDAEKSSEKLIEKNTTMNLSNKDADFLILDVCGEILGHRKKRSNTQERATPKKKAKVASEPPEPTPGDLPRNGLSLATFWGSAVYSIRLSREVALPFLGNLKDEDPAADEGPIAAKDHAGDDEAAAENFAATALARASASAIVNFCKRPYCGHDCRSPCRRRGCRRKISMAHDAALPNDVPASLALEDADANPVAKALVLEYPQGAGPCRWCLPWEPDCCRSNPTVPQPVCALPFFGTAGPNAKPSTHPAPLAAPPFEASTGSVAAKRVVLLQDTRAYLEPATSLHTCQPAHLHGAHDDEINATSLAHLVAHTEQPSVISSTAELPLEASRSLCTYYKRCSHMKCTFISKPTLLLRSPSLTAVSSVFLLLV